MTDQHYVRENEQLKQRVLWLTLAACVFFFLILTRLWYLQVIETENLRSMSESNRLRFVPVAAPRGAILDRNGKVLVSNTPSFSVAVIPQDVKDKEALLDALVHHLGLDRTELRGRVGQGEGEGEVLPAGARLGDHPGPDGVSRGEPAAASPGWRSR